MALVESGIPVFISVIKRILHAVISETNDAAVFRRTLEKLQLKAQLLDQELTSAHSSELLEKQGRRNNVLVIHLREMKARSDQALRLVRRLLGESRLVRQVRLHTTNLREEIVDCEDNLFFAYMNLNRILREDLHADIQELKSSKRTDPTVISDAVDADLRDIETMRLSVAQLTTQAPPHNPAPVESVQHLLSLASRHPYFLEEIVSVHGVESLFKVLDSPCEREVAMVSFKLLDLMFRHGHIEQEKHLVLARCALNVVAVYDAPFDYGGLELLTSLSAKDFPQTNDFIVKQGGCELVVDLLKRHDASPFVQSLGWALLGRLLGNNCIARYRLRTKTISFLIERTALAQRHNPDVLCKIMTAACCFFDGASNIDAYPILNSAVLPSLQSSPTNATIFRTAVKLVGVLMLCKDSNQAGDILRTVTQNVAKGLLSLIVAEKECGVLVPSQNNADAKAEAVSLLKEMVAVVLDSDNSQEETCLLSLLEGMLLQTIDTQKKTVQIFLSSFISLIQAPGK